MEVAVPDGGLQSFQSPQFLVSERDRFLGQRLQPLGGADYQHGHALEANPVRAETAVLKADALRGSGRRLVPGLRQPMISLSPSTTRATSSCDALPSRRPIRSTAS